MKILQICSKPPFPKKDGYALAVNHITEALIAQGHRLKVIAISTPKHGAEDVPKSYKATTNFEYLFIDTTVRVVPAFLNLFSKNSYNTNRFYDNAFAIRLKQILRDQDFDIVLFEGLFVCPYFKVISENSNAKTVLRAHNIEADIWKGIVNQENNLIKKIYLKLLQKKLRNYEKSIVSKMDAIIGISDRDTYWLKQHRLETIWKNRQVATIPFAIDKVIKQVHPEEKNTIFHIGSMDWKANLDGIKWFLADVFPLVTRQKKEITLHLAGRNTPSLFNHLINGNIIIDGEVESATAFMGKYNLMIVPLLNGSGIRIKILEGMAMGKTIISTTIGASGIKCQDQYNILIADTAEQFASQIIWCLENPLERNQIGENAKKNIQEYYNTDKISRQLDSFLNKIIRS